MTAMVDPNPYAPPPIQVQPRCPSSISVDEEGHVVRCIKRVEGHGEMHAAPGGYVWEPDGTLYIVPPPPPPPPVPMPDLCLMPDPKNLDAECREARGHAHDHANATRSHTWPRWEGDE